jgi:amino acid permease
VYEGLQTLGEGAILVGLVLGTMVTYILEKKFLYAAIASAVGAVLSFIGLIHAPRWRGRRIPKSRLVICSSGSSALPLHFCRARRTRLMLTRPISSRVTD